MKFSRRKYWSGLPFPFLADLHDPGIELLPLMSPALGGQFFTTRPPARPLVSFNLEQFLSLCLYFIVLIFLRVKGRLFCRMLLSLGLFSSFLSSQIDLGFALLAHTSEYTSFLMISERFHFTQAFPDCRILGSCIILLQFQNVALSLFSHQLSIDLSPFICIFKDILTTFSRTLLSICSPTADNWPCTLAYYEIYFSLGRQKLTLHCCFNRLHLK